MLSLKPRPLVRKAEIQSLVALVGGVLNVIISLLLTHSRPLLLSLLVSENIVCFGKHVECESQTIDSNQLHVATMVQWFIVLSKDVSPST
jgi:hypothetical protein